MTFFGAMYKQIDQQHVFRDFIIISESRHTTPKSPKNITDMIRVNDKEMNVINRPKLTVTPRAYTLDMADTQ